MDIFDVLSGTAVPTAEATVYLNAPAVQKYRSLLDRYNALEDQGNYEGEDLREKLKGTAAEAKSSKLVFHLRGIDGDERETFISRFQRVEKDKDKVKGIHPFFVDIVTSMLAYVEDAQGNRDDRDWTTDDVKKILNKLPGEQYMIVTNAALDLLSRSADYASEITEDF